MKLLTTRLPLNVILTSTIWHRGTLSPSFLSFELMMTYRWTLTSLKTIGVPEMMLPLTVCRNEWYSWQRHISTRAAVSSCLPSSSFAIFPFLEATINCCSYLEMHLSQLMWCFVEARYYGVIKLKFYSHHNIIAYKPYIIQTITTTLKVWKFNQK